MAEVLQTADKKEAEIARIETDKLAQQVAVLVIRKDADLAEATEFLSQVKQTAKNIKAKKDAIINPAKAVVKATNELFKPAEDSLKAAEAAIKSSMLKYQSQVEARAAKKADKIEEQVDSGDLGLAEGMAKLGSIKQAPTSVAADSGSVSFKEGPRKLRITDPAQIPARYFMHPRVVEALRLVISEDVLKNDMPCPAGAEVYREKIVAGRTNG